MHGTHTIYSNNAFWEWKELLYGSNIMNAIARQESGSKLKGLVTDRTLPSQSFIWLPFAAGISAFAVILPQPTETGYGVGAYPDASHVNGCGAKTLDRGTDSDFESL
jgi:hypothetical protein